MSKNTPQEAFPQLETKRLILREMRTEDTEAIFRMYGDEEVMRYRDVLAFTRLEEAQRFLEEARTRYERGEEIHWAITLKGEDALIGTCGYSWHLGPRFGAIGYDLARRSWKQGIMTEAIETLLRFGFEVRNLHRVEARVRRGNEASMRLLRRLGFQEEGLLRECLFLNHSFYDVQVFSLLASELETFSMNTNKEVSPAMSTPKTPPRWDMSVVYPGLDSPEFDRGFAHFVQHVSNLVQLFDRNHIQRREASELSAATVQTFEEVTTRYNDMLEEATTLGTYLDCFVTTNTQDTLAQARLSSFQQQAARLSLLGTRYAAWIGSLDMQGLFVRASLAHDHAYLLHKAGELARHLMLPAEEDLAAELELSSGASWERLHGDITSQIRVPIEIQGERQKLPMSVVRHFAVDPDREVRWAAYKAELIGWKEAAVPLAAALNGIKGQTNTISRRRGWNSPLDASLFDANIDRETLEAMLTAARESFPDFRRYLRTKARMLGLEKLAWYDIGAPTSLEKQTWDFEKARDFIVARFGDYSQRLSDFADRAFRENWIDAEPRAGKVNRAYCMPLRRDESRVFVNFQPSFNGVCTLAHELGHGYHNLNLVNRTPLQKETPLTLAETASIFCETIITHAALARANREEQIAILESSLQRSCQAVVDISSRFLFESRVLERRKQRELSVDEFNELMLEAEMETYGDGLDEHLLHPYMWAMKPHYYSSRLSFYNYPYMFGLLFGLGLYARYQQDTESFKASYDDLLSSTGLADVATLAARFGIDVRSTTFWRSSLDMVRQDIDLFEKLMVDG